MSPGAIVINSARVRQTLAMQRGRFIAMAIVIPIASLLACGSSSPSAATDPKDGLLATTQMPKGWHPYPAQALISKTDLCGAPFPADIPTPQRQAAAAWTIDPNNGPIFGERVEQYKDGSEFRASTRDASRFPCEFVQGGTRWRTTAAAPPRSGSGGSVRLVINQDRTDSFNYEVAIPLGSSVLKMVLNSRVPNRELLDNLVARAYRQFASANK